MCMHTQISCCPPPRALLPITPTQRQGSPVTTHPPTPSLQPLTKPLTRQPSVCSTLTLRSPPPLSSSPLVPFSTVVLLRSSLTGGPVGSLRLGCRTCDCASPGSPFVDEGEEALRGGAVPRVHLAYLSSLLHWPDRCTEPVGVTGRWRLGGAAMGWAQFIRCDELRSSPSCAPACSYGPYIAFMNFISWVHRRGPIAFI